MANKPTHEFGKRRPAPAAPIVSVPAKRSSHVALLLMGTLAVGGGAYALMPGDNCQPTAPGMAAPTGCQPRGSSSGGGSGGGSSRYGFFSGGSSSGSSSASTTTSSDSGSSHVSRGGFGSFAHSFGAHFSGG
ncbi:MAG: hypothetical protein K2X57_24170 [Xanthobacteraceae bacterium]|nr:hypothetical protein [Xanthobacteraceae bacterium]